MTSYDFSNLDFDTLKSELISYIKNTDEFRDYEFEGSALNSLAGLLTYITLQQNYYLNMTTQELYLNTATIYRNAVAIAKSLNYLPNRRKSAKINVTVQLNEENNSFTENSYPVLIPQNCKFDVGGKSFITDTSYNINNLEPLELTLYQREMVVEEFYYNSEPLELINGYSIDNDLITVSVDGDIWEQYNNDISVGASSEVFFVDLNLNEKLVISFGNNTIGKSPNEGSTIKVTYGITEGFDGNGVSATKLLDILTGNDGKEYVDSDVIIVVESSSYGGVDKESLNSIKVNAPKFYEAQNRAVTRRDYQILLKEIPFVEILNVWDGSEEVPPIYGTVFSTFKPFSGSDLLTDDQKNEIKTYIKKYMPLSVRMEIVNPVYIYVNINSDVYYYKNFNTSTSAIRSSIENNIIEYFRNNLLVYDTKLKYSNLINVIDEVEEVSNNLTELTLNIKFDKTVLASNQYNFEIKNALLPKSIDNEFVKDDGLGNIISKADNSTIGLVNYDTGVIEFVFDNMNDTDNLLYFKTKIEDVNFEKNILPVLGKFTFTFNGV